MTNRFLDDDEARAKASEMYADDNHEFDEPVAGDLSHADNGVWVRGWFWVPYPEEDE